MFLYRHFKSNGYSTNKIVSQPVEKLYLIQIQIAVLDSQRSYNFSFFAKHIETDNLIARDGFG